MAFIDASVADAIALTDAVTVSMTLFRTAPTILSKRLVANSDHTPFAINAYVTDTSGCEEIKSAPAAGSFIVLEQLSVICADNITVTIGAGEADGTVTNVIWGPLAFNTEVTAAGYKVGVQYRWPFTRQLKLPAATALTVDASGAGSVIVMAEGLVI